MACGLPVVNTSLDSAVPFVSLHGETGLTVAPQSAEELASAMNLLLADEHLRTQYGRAARRRVEREFSADVMTQRTLELYHEVLDRRESTVPIYATRHRAANVPVLDESLVP